MDELDYTDDSLDANYAPDSESTDSSVILLSRKQVFKHKTSRKYGPASLRVSEELYWLLNDYLLTYDNCNKSLYLFFSTSSKSAITSSCALRQMQDAWKRGGMKGTFTTTKLRKSIVTATHRQKPHLAAKLAHHMSHSESTAKKIYNCVNSSRNSVEVTKEVEDLEF